jgi:tetratricopeptide (TPR) repeat protein
MAIPALAGMADFATFTMDTLGSPRILFGGETSPAIASLLERAMVCYADTQLAETLLWQAQDQAPEALPVYFSLYKFYFYKGDLKQAERAARMALLAAAMRGGFDADWRILQQNSTDWQDYAAPAHFYLFSLKALAFIRLRRQDVAEASAILAKLAELDPRDSVGASVIRTIMEGAS